MLNVTNYFLEKTHTYHFGVCRNTSGNYTIYMVGPQDGGFGFDGAPKYSDLEGKNAICVQCQAGQHGKCLAKNNQNSLCDCELCMIS